MLMFSVEKFLLDSVLWAFFGNWAGSCMKVRRWSLMSATTTPELIDAALEIGCTSKKCGFSAKACQHVDPLFVVSLLQVFSLSCRGLKY